MTKRLCGHPLLAPQSITRGYCDACRIANSEPNTVRIAECASPQQNVTCGLCGTGINPVFGITTHYDCKRKAENSK